MQNDRPLILIVDDETKIRRLVARNLEDFGYDVVPAADGFKALAYFEEKTSDLHPDLILMDVMMPEMNGHEAARQIRALPRKDAATVPILAMSANAYVEDIQASLDAGMNTHIIKPIDLNQLIRTLRLYLS